MKITIISWTFLCALCHGQEVNCNDSLVDDNDFPQICDNLKSYIECFNKSGIDKSREFCAAFVVSSCSVCGGPGAPPTLPDPPPPAPPPPPQATQTGSGLRLGPPGTALPPWCFFFVFWMKSRFN